MSDETIIPAIINNPVKSKQMAQHGAHVVTNLKQSRQN